MGAAGLDPTSWPAELGEPTLLLFSGVGELPRYAVFSSGPSGGLAVMGTYDEGPPRFDRPMEQVEGHRRPTWRATHGSAKWLVEMTAGVVLVLVRDLSDATGEQVVRSLTLVGDPPPSP